MTKSKRYEQLLQVINKTRSVGKILEIIEQASKGKNKLLEWGSSGDNNDCSKTVFTTIYTNHHVIICFTAKKSFEGDYNFTICISNSGFNGPAKERAFEISGKTQNFKNWNEVKNWKKTTELFDKFYGQVLERFEKSFC